VSEYAWNFEREMPHVHPRPDMVSVLPEPHHPLVKAFEGIIAQLRWHLDALREWCRRLGMSVKEHRIDPDYNPEDDVRVLRKAIDHLRLVGGQKFFNGDSGDKRVLNWILGVLSALAVSAVIGSVAMYGRLTSLESKVTSMMEAHEARITRLENINERRYRELQ
jgi:hypothetical protein